MHFISAFLEISPIHFTKISLLDVRIEGNTNCTRCNDIYSEFIQLFSFPIKTVLGRKYFANFLETQIDPSKDNNDGKNGANAARSG